MSTDWGENVMDMRCYISLLLMTGLITCVKNTGYWNLMGLCWLGLVRVVASGGLVHRLVWCFLRHVRQWCFGLAGSVSVISQAVKAQIFSLAS